MNGALFASFVRGGQSSVILGRGDAMARGDKPTLLRAQAIFDDWYERTGDHRVAASRAGVSERTGRRWRQRHGGTERAEPGSSEARTNLVPDPTSFIGRQEALRGLRALFTGGASLVTVLGPGGIGKTRLARRYADLHLLDYARDRRGGAWFCDLTEARSEEDLCGALGHVLGVPLAGRGRADDSVEQLGRAIAGRGALLLILDNCEQVLPAAASAVRRWMALAPRAHWLVTSRARLGLPGEACFQVEALELPGRTLSGARAIGATEAVQLYVDRARLVRPSYSLSDADARIVAEIVRRLDGVPLAIDLAAARAAVLPPAQILDRLRRPLELLTAARGTNVARRQGSMRATVDWSWGLLDPVEQAALAECSVFRGGFTLEAAEGVLALSPLAGAQALDVLESLCQKSLLRADPQHELSREARFGMYESIREYAAERLRETPDGGSGAAERHARYYIALGGELALAVDGKDGALARKRLAAELDNFVGVWQWAMARRPVDARSVRNALRAALAIFLVRSLVGPSGSEIALIDEALAVAPADLDPQIRAWALLARGDARRSHGQPAAAEQDLERAIHFAQVAGDTHVEGLSIAATGRLLHASGRLDEAERLHNRALELARRVGDRKVEARAHGNLAAVYAIRARHAESLEHAERALAIHRELGNARLEGETLGVVAMAYQGQQRMDDARAAYERSILLAREHGDRGLEAMAYGNLGTLTAELGNFDRAREYFERAHCIFRELGLHRLEGTGLGNLAALQAETGLFAEALESARRAVDLLRASGDTLQVALFLAHKGAALAELGALEDARAAFDQSEAMFEPHAADPAAAIVGVARGHLDLALARAETAAGDTEAAARHLADARGRLGAAGAPGDAHASGDVRQAARILERALDAFVASDRGDRPATGALVVRQDTRAFRAPGAETVKLERRRALRLLLRKLVDQRLAAPGEVLSMNALLAAGWPGEKVLADAGAGRVYVGLATLRRLGLRRLLLSRDGGYLLDPGVDVVLVPTLPERI